MKVLQRLQTLVDYGLIQEVGRAVQAGKEAEVYVVVVDGRDCCAKVYKKANNRGFRNRAQYEEGRNVRSSRRGRAMRKGSKFGKAQLEEAWQSSEVDALYRLADAGVRVPKPLAFVEGILVMELITDSAGEPAPRLAALDLDAELAEALHQLILHQIVGMLCAGLVHADLSEYNILVNAEGPVIIDVPQAVNAAGNNNAKRLLLRDVRNITSYLSTFHSGLAKTDYGREIWDLYEQGLLVPDTPLTGKYKAKSKQANVSNVLRDIGDAREQAERQGKTNRRKRRGDHGRARPARPESAAPIVDEWSGHGEAGGGGGSGEGSEAGSGEPPRGRREYRPEPSERAGGGARKRGRGGERGGGERRGGQPGRGRTQGSKSAPNAAAKQTGEGVAQQDPAAPAKKKRRRRRKRRAQGPEGRAPATADNTQRGGGAPPKGGDGARRAGNRQQPPEPRRAGGGEAKGSDGNGAAPKRRRRRRRRSRGGGGSEGPQSPPSG